MASNYWGFFGLCYRLVLLVALLFIVGVGMATERVSQAENAYSRLDMFDAQRNSFHVAEIEDRVRGGESAAIWLRLAIDWLPDAILERQRGNVAVRDQRAQLELMENQLRSGLESRDITIIKQYRGFIPWMVVAVDQDTLDFVLDHPAVAGVVPDYEAAFSIDKSAPYINASAEPGEPFDRGAWEFGFDGLGQIVAVLDSGIRRDHMAFEEASQRLFAEACFSTDSIFVSGDSICPNGEDTQFGPGSAAEGPGTLCDNTVEKCGHGTHVASIAAGNFTSNDGRDLKGMAKRARLMPIRVARLHDDGCEAQDTCVRPYMPDVASALSYITDSVDSGANIAAVNMSFGLAEGTSDDPILFDSWCLESISGVTDAIAQLVNRQVSVVASSGNHGGDGQLAYPACLASTIAVAASGKDSSELYIDNNMAEAVDLFAPGISVDAADAGHTAPDRLMSRYGTSMAAPHVAGAIAILKQQRPSAQIWQDTLPALEASPVQLSHRGFTRPRLDILATVGHEIQTPSSPRHVDAEGGEYEFQVAADDEVSWVAKPGSPEYSSAWITLTSGQGEGNGIVSYQVAENPASEARVGEIQVFDKSVVIYQSGSAGQPDQAPTAQVSISTSSPSTGTTVNVDGSESYDPGGFPLAYTWALVQRPGGSSASLNATSGEVTGFQPDLPGEYSIELTVSNGVFDDSAVSSVVVTEQDTGEIIVEGEEVYFENVNLGTCDLEHFDPVTVNLNEIWTRFTFAYSQADLVFLIRKGSPVEMTDEPPFNCENGYAPDFTADGLFDFWDGSAIFHHDMNAVPGEQIHFAMFSYDGESDINVPGYFDVETGPVSAPGFSPAAGLYMSPIDVSISGDSDTTVRYTLDGSTPDSSSPVFSSPITVPEDSSVQVRAKAFHPHFQDSIVSEAMYVVTGQVDDVDLSHASGTYPAGLSLELAGDSGSVIRYTLDGSTPDESSPAYTVPLDLDPAPGSGSTGQVVTHTVKARAFRPGWSPSDVVTGQFELTGQLDPPAVSLPSGQYIGEQTIDISAPFPSASVAYRTDGSLPDCAVDPLHKSQVELTLDADMQLRARSCKSDWSPSTGIASDYQFVPAASVTIGIGPQEAADAGASWRLSTDGIWRSSGDLAESVPAVPTIIEFSPLAGWLHPPEREIDLSAQEDTSLQVAYSEIQLDDSIFGDDFLPWQGLPTVSIQIDGQSSPTVIAGDTFTVEWLSEGSETCLAQGDFPWWRGTIPEGGEVTLPTTASDAGSSFVLELECQNGAGTSQADVSVVVVSP